MTFVTFEDVIASLKSRKFYIGIIIGISSTVTALTLWQDQESQNQNSEISLLKTKIEILGDQITSQTNQLDNYKGQLSELNNGVGELNIESNKNTRNLDSLSAGIAEIQRDIRGLSNYGKIEGGADASQIIPEIEITLKRGQTWSTLEDRAKIYLDRVLDNLITIYFSGFDKKANGQMNLTKGKMIQIPYKDRTFSIKVLEFDELKQEAKFLFGEL